MIEEGTKVRIVAKHMAAYRKETLQKFDNKVGTVVAIDVGYQAPEIYTVVFETSPLLYEDFFEDEVEDENVIQEEM